MKIFSLRASVALKKKKKQNQIIFIFQKMSMFADFVILFSNSSPNYIPLRMIILVYHFDSTKVPSCCVKYQGTVKIMLAHVKKSKIRYRVSIINKPQ